MNITKISKAVKPPAKKKEVIEAMAIRLVQLTKIKFNNEERAIAAEQKEVDGKCGEWFMANLTKLDHKHTVRVSIATKYDGNMRSIENATINDCGIAFTPNKQCQLPVEYSKKLIELAKRGWRNQQENRWVVYSSERDQLKEARARVLRKIDNTKTPSERVNELLKDKDSLATIDKLVAALEQPSQLTLQ